MTRSDTVFRMMLRFQEVWRYLGVATLQEQQNVAKIWKVMTYVCKCRRPLNVAIDELIITVETLRHACFL